MFLCCANIYPTKLVLTPQIDLNKNLFYAEELVVAIVERQVKKLCSKEVASVKVISTNHSTEEGMWESEDVMHSRYPHLFDNQGEYVSFGIRGPNFTKGNNVTPRVLYTINLHSLAFVSLWAFF